VARVQRAAQELDYRPDPGLSALAAYRSRLRVRQEFGVIAIVSNWSSRTEWSQRKSAQKLIDGATARASALGYILQHFWSREGGASPARFSRMLVSRGIRGIILAPFERPESRFDLDWENFSVVTIERPALYTRFHHVVPNYYADMLLAWDQLRARGYQRIGLVLDGELAERVAHQWEAAHSFEQNRHSAGEPAVPTLLLNAGDSAATVTRWIRRHRPDAVISRSDRAFQPMIGAGVRVPQDIGYVSLNTVDDAPDVSGILQLRDAMGAAAVDALNALLLLSARGPSEFSQGTHVDGVWHEGRTVRRAP
jgi:DNA-binding LacI/PurR family transcriptional regulator